MKWKYKEMFDLEKRKEESARIRENYQDRIPVICEKDPKAKGVTEIQKTKFLVPFDMTVTQFSYIIRRKLELPKEAALFLLVNAEKSVSGNQTINEIYQTSRDQEDGFLYIAYSSELSWGE